MLGLKGGIKLSMNNVNCSHPKIKCYQLYMSVFIKDGNKATYSFIYIIKIDIVAVRY